MGKNFKQSMVFKASALLLALLLALPGHLVFAQTNNIVGNLLLPSVPYDPPVLRGIKLDPANPLKFDFIVYEGQNPLSQAALKIESAKLIRYFLAGLTIPENDLWVNLSPYERDKIVPQEFSQTDIGKEMLAQDYLLKQLAASLTCPETEAGKKYWDEINNYTIIAEGKLITTYKKRLSDNLKKRIDDLIRHDKNKPAETAKPEKSQSEEYVEHLKLYEKQIITLEKEIDNATTNAKELNEKIV